VRASRQEPTGRSSRTRRPRRSSGAASFRADTIEFFDLVLETKMTAQEKGDLRAFLLAL
jgi:hypothetical protein